MNTKMKKSDYYIVWGSLIFVCFSIFYLWYITNIKDAYIPSTNIQLIFACLLILSIIVELIISIRKNIFYQRKMKLWRKTLKVGDEVVLSMGDKGRDIEGVILEKNENNYTIEIVVSEDKLHFKD